VTFFRGILQKETPISARPLDRMVRHFNEQGRPSSEIDALTKRETDVLCLIAKGFSVAESSHVLGISQHTVKGYVKDIYAKLGISSRAEATAVAIRARLVSV
jgi:DNA-binding NarL/FixJ family response regulator